MQLDKTTRIAIPALVVLVILLALLFPWRCTAQEQVSVAVTLTPDQQAVMQEAHGKDWSVWLHDRLREAARNHLSAARETMIRRTAARLRSAAVTPEEAVTVNRILDSARVREERRQAAEEMERRRIDSVAAEKKIGMLLRETDQPQLAGLGIGKMSHGKSVALILRFRNYPSMRDGNE
jgi:hypothetical protein